MAETTVTRCFTPCEEHTPTGIPEDKRPAFYKAARLYTLLRDCDDCKALTQETVRTYAQTQGNKRQSYTFSPGNLKWWWGRRYANNLPATPPNHPDWERHWNARLAAWTQAAIAS